MTRLHCSDCRFYSPGEPPAFGQCKESPPQIFIAPNLDREGKYTVLMRSLNKVSADDWCGKLMPIIPPAIEPYP